MLATQPWFLIIRLIVKMSKTAYSIIVLSAYFILWRFEFVLVCPNWMVMLKNWRYHTLTKGIRTIKTFTKYKKYYSRLIYQKNTTLKGKTFAVLRFFAIFAKFIPRSLSKLIIHESLFPRKMSKPIFPNFFKS